MQVHKSSDPNPNPALNPQVYDSARQLRYGHLMIMTDQDHDGSHIKGLIMNFFHHFYPTLLRVPGFLLEFITPIVKARRARCCRPSIPIQEPLLSHSIKHASMRHARRLRAHAAAGTAGRGPGVRA